MSEFTILFAFWNTMSFNEISQFDRRNGDNIAGYWIPTFFALNSFFENFLFSGKSKSNFFVENFYIFSCNMKLIRGFPVNSAKPFVVSSIAGRNIRDNSEVKKNILKLLDETFGGVIKVYAYRCSAFSCLNLYSAISIEKSRNKWRNFFFWRI